MSDSVSESLPEPTPKRGLLGRLLEPALHLWLKSQVESVERLWVHLEGGDRQLLSGYLPLLQLEADTVVYEGLHLSQVKLLGRHIQLNVGQILKGKPLQLLAPVPVELEVILEADDAQQSLHSDLFQAALLDALRQLVGEQIMEALGQPISSQTLQLHEPVLTLSPHQLRLKTQLQHSATHQTIPIALQTGLGLLNPYTLILQQPEWLPTPQARRGLPLSDLDGYPFNLGSEVQLDTLLISETHIRVRGILTILPPTS